MSGEKTEKATPKKRRDAREKGQVRQSTEVNTAFCCVIMFGLLFLIWPWFVERNMALITEMLSYNSIIITQDGFSQSDVMLIYPRILLNALYTLFPILAAAMIAGTAINVLQVGFMFTTKPLGMKFDRINPISGFKRMFSVKTLVDLLKSLLKVIVLGYIAYKQYMIMLDEFPNMVGRDVYLSFIHIMRSAFLMALKMCIAMVFIATADFIYQWWKYEKDLRMTKQEVRDEYKLTEGDPKIRSKIRQKQRQMSMMRMMSRVPEADVVITNPTHYAIALKYDENISGAPMVIAKGQDYVAKKIREKAQEFNIEIVENPPLAQALYAMCEINDEIPADFYQAVADILVFVYKQKGKIRS
ncbi:MAG: flagellar biosynthesis protein FlhB [Oscillospiraceae bacterium]|nr:flagellar biosynthesis protein FlhB [Oscillospiraceae bacterium]